MAAESVLVCPACDRSDQFEKLSIVNVYENVTIKVDDDGRMPGTCVGSHLEASSKGNPVVAWETEDIQEFRCKCGGFIAKVSKLDGEPVFS